MRDDPTAVIFLNVMLRSVLKKIVGISLDFGVQHLV